MSEREKRVDQEPRVSPYLLRPARTYEEYLRDRAIADRLQQQFERGVSLKDAAATTASANAEEKPAKQSTWTRHPPSADAAMAVPRQSDRGDTANNQA